MFTGVYVLFCILGSVFGEDENEAKLRFYHDSFDNYKEISLDEATNIFSTSWYNANKTTMIFCHGFTGHPNGPAVATIIKAYLVEGQSNVALLNWEKLAASIYNTIPSSYLNWAVPNAIKLAAKFADTLLNLSQAGLDLNNTHLLGHSLGAQIMGIAGNNIAQKGILLPWITGLDPAGVAFDSKRPRHRLNPNSARFVDVIHSDPSKYGSRISLGTVDFWPNYKQVGPVQQPGCDRQNQQTNTTSVLKDLCNHNRCWEYLLDAKKYPGTILGSHAKNYRTWKNYSNKQKTATVLEMGKFKLNAVPGNYYLLTADSSPFGFGEAGL